MLATVNLMSRVKAKVDSGIITAGMKETGTGNITVKDKNSVITNLELILVMTTTAK